MIYRQKEKDGNVSAEVQNVLYATVLPVVVQFLSEEDIHAFKMEYRIWSTFDTLTMLLV